MIMDDDTLSAFLDAELENSEMEAVREALADDESLAMRLAELALVDELVRDACQRINQLPLPAIAGSAVVERPPARVLPFRRSHSRPPRWRNIPAIAAALLLAAGLTVIAPWQSGDNSLAPDVVAALEHTPSGHERALADGTVLKPRLTFRSHQGGYCRQYQLREAGQVSEAIACQATDGWQLEAFHAETGPANVASGEYVTATEPRALDTELDRLMAEAPLNSDAEAQLIAREWQQPSGK